MDAFMAEHFPQMRVKDCSAFFRGPRGSKQMSSAGYVELSSSDVRDLAMKKIDTEKLHLSCGGKDLHNKKARSKVAGQRNAALRQASDLLKTHAESSDDVIIVWSRESGVTVKGVYAFSQPVGEALGDFIGQFAHLILNKSNGK